MSDEVMKVIDGRTVQDDADDAFVLLGESSNEVRMKLRSAREILGRRKFIRLVLDSVKIHSKGPRNVYCFKRDGSKRSVGGVFFKLSKLRVGPTKREEIFRAYEHIDGKVGAK
jgi:hypothetical protein